MAADRDALPVLVIDGADFSELDGFARAFSKLLRDHTWNGNLDAFDDILDGGFGTPESGWVLRWQNSALSRSAFGHEATVRRLEQMLRTCHPSNRADVAARMRNAERGEGPTQVDEILEIIHDHRAEDAESGNGIVLELR